MQIEIKVGFIRMQVLLINSKCSNKLIRKFCIKKVHTFLLNNFANEYNRYHSSSSYGIHRFQRSVNLLGAAFDKFMKGKLII